MSVDSASSVSVVSTSGVPGRAPTWLRAIFMANLVAQTGIVLTGGLVRLTGSGSVAQRGLSARQVPYVPTAEQEQAWHKYVEFGNRTLTFLLGVLAIAAIVGAIGWNYRNRQRTGVSRCPMCGFAAVPLLGTPRSGRSRWHYRPDRAEPDQCVHPLPAVRHSDRAHAAFFGGARQRNRR